MDDKKAIGIKLGMKVPSHMAFTIVLVLSFLLVLYTLDTAGKIIKNAKNSASFNIQKRLGVEIPDNAKANNPSVNVNKPTQ